MRTLIVLYPQKEYEPVIIEECIQDAIGHDYNCLCAPSQTVQKLEFYIIPGPDDKLDDSKMIPVESIKEISKIIQI